ncbi:MAG TPA: WYL domain-containing protein [Firmicutes bacterium]|nr:MAG: hypothetical protein DRH44_00205 [Candidatus Coatesbacteria bacterium]HDM42926.1 WYL domain-containing protein [Bacillota bacterium]
MRGYMGKFLERIMEISRLISSGNYPNREQLAEKLGVDKRTITRYIAWMKNQLNAPIEFNRKKNGYIFTRPFDLFPDGLSSDQVLTLFLLNKVSKQLWDNDTKLSPEKIISRVKNYIDEKIITGVEDKASRINFRIGKPRVFDSNTYSHLLEALFENYQCKISYFSMSSGPSERVIEPYHLINIRGDWYVIAYCHKRKEVRTFALSRINKIKVLKQPFTVRDDFNIDEYLAYSFVIERGERKYKVRIRFAPEVAWLIGERIWHSSQSIEKLDDGSLILQMELSGLNEVKRWVLSFGEYARVLQPPELIDMVANTVERIDKLYKSSG